MQSCFCVITHVMIHNVDNLLKIRSYINISGQKRFKLFNICLTHLTQIGGILITVKGSKSHIIQNKNFSLLLIKYTFPVKTSAATDVFTHLRGIYCLLRKDILNAILVL